MRLILLLLFLAHAGQATSQHNHDAATHAVSGPQETGQSAFAALAEIVTILREDPETDWDSVDIASLRRHLVDMDLLTTGAEVTAKTRPKGARFEIRGTPRVLEAVQAMVPAHAPFLAAETGWNVSVDTFEDLVVLTVDGEAARIQGLGFFGMMAIGAHHQEHHLMVAKGAAPHE
ncbi:MAG: hypothetical protein KJO30_02540 [Boseongicola sp.]|nr:hypothetical protein [Boseongicola sp.]